MCPFQLCNYYTMHAALENMHFIELFENKILIDHPFKYVS